MAQVLKNRDIPASSKCEPQTEGSPQARRGDPASVIYMHSMITGVVYMGYHVGV